MADLKVFVSHSFDSADAELIDKILEVMQQRRRFHLEVRTARDRQSRPFPDKIKGLVDWADITFGIYTRKFADSNGQHFPSPYVISECSYALGRYQEHDRKTVLGIVEDPIRYESLGLNVAQGEEFPNFHREDFLTGKMAALEQYLQDLDQRHGARAAPAPSNSYKQRLVSKTVEVYRGGLGVFKNKSEFFIKNATDFRNEGNQIIHHIWLPNKIAAFPDFEEMVRTPVKDRYKKPFFAAMFSGARDRTEQSMNVRVLYQDPYDIKLSFEFPFTVKDSDVLEYQYVWSHPKTFYTFEDDQQKDGVDVQQIALVCRHGLIDTAELQVKFERETIYGKNPLLFSKQPFVVFSRSGESEWVSSKAINIHPSTRDPVFEIYEYITTKLQRGIAMRWSPGSRRYLQMQLSGPAPDEPFGPSAEKPITLPKIKKTAD